MTHGGAKPDNRCVTEAPRAREVLESLIGQEIHTVTGKPNRVARLEHDAVIVATQRSPEGTPVPVIWVKDAIDRLHKTREIEVSVESLGYRSAFVGAVLLTLPDAVLVRTTPPRIRLGGGTGHDGS
jgi:hypothetical protein